MNNVNQIYLHVKPYFGTVGEPVSIVVQGLNVNDYITLKLCGEDDKKRLWCSSAKFVADSEGIVDISKSPALSGSYQGLDGAGLFWSMRQKEGVEFSGSIPMIENMHVTVYDDNDAPLATQTFKRVYFHDDIIRMTVYENGLVGEYYCPKILEKPLAAIVVIGGAEGGVKSKFAALLAYNLKCPVFAVAYFQKRSLPKKLLNVPVETVERAIEWLNNRDEVQKDCFGIVGFSRGSELTFLSAALLPQIKAVVAYIPSMILFEGLGGSLLKSHATWTHKGQPLPYMPFRRNISNISYFLWKKLISGRVSTRKLFIDSVDYYADTLEDATVKIEHSNADILFISGKNDLIWPASIFGDMLMKRLKEKAYQYRYEHLSYDNAGHMITFPYCSMMNGMIFLKSVGLYEMVGGTPQGNAAASLDSWEKMLDFLRESLSL